MPAPYARDRTRARRTTHAHHEPDFVLGASAPSGSAAFWRGRGQPVRRARPSPCRWRAARLPAPRAGGCSVLGGDGVARSPLGLRMGGSCVAAGPDRREGVAVAGSDRGGRRRRVRGRPADRPSQGGVEPVVGRDRRLRRILARVRAGAPSQPGPRAGGRRSTHPGASPTGSEPAGPGSGVGSASGTGGAPGSGANPSGLMPAGGPSTDLRQVPAITCDRRLISAIARSYASSPMPAS